MAVSVSEQFRRDRNCMVWLLVRAEASLDTSMSPRGALSRLMARMVGSAEVRMMLSIWGGMRLPLTSGMWVGF